MLSFNYQAPIHTFMTLVDNINYLYEEVSVEKVKTYSTDIKAYIDKNVDESEVSNSTKKRILTYYRNELLVMYTDNIAYIFIENSITYIVNMDGKKSIVNESLDNLFAELNPRFFFRVNRQIIIRIPAIKKIIKMGNGLKVETYPPSHNAIIIGKNKALAFKKWIEE